nr:methionyl-tRNA formyltransferase, mitochondrial isoform X2 [Maniola hyperantus]
MMTSKVYNLAPLLNKIFLKEKCSYLQNIHHKRHYNVLFFGSEAIALNSLQKVNQFRGMINVHPSLLPRWRGAAPMIYTLLHGDEVGGVSLMKIKPDIFDVGEIISQRRVPIPKDIKLPELTQQLSDIGAEMLIECLRCLPASLANTQPQSNEGVTYAKKINKSISIVSWNEKSAREVYNLYRAIYGLYPLTTKFRDKQMKLFDAFLVETDPEFNEKSVGTLEYCENTKAIRILCKDKRFIYFKSLRIVGKREISALDFYNGYIKNIVLDKRKIVII